MYYEEYLPQDDVYDPENKDEIVSISISSEDDSEIIESKFNTQEKKQSDPGYRKQKILLNGEIVKIETFATTTSKYSAKIRNAITGHRTPHIVGKDDELYFSVVDTTCSSTDHRKMYFISPEQFERHYHNTMSVPVGVKEKWMNRNMKLNM